jgi:hypothetical protein
LSEVLAVRAKHVAPQSDSEGWLGELGTGPQAHETAAGDATGMGGSGHTASAPPAQASSRTTKAALLPALSTILLVEGCWAGWQRAMRKAGSYEQGSCRLA